MKCPFCRSDIPDGSKICPVCGAVLDSSAPLFSLPKGTKLNNGRYSIGEVLGQGGFGITYRAFDLIQKKKVVVKEMFISGSVRNSNTVLQPHNYSVQEYSHFKDRFKEEGELLKKINTPNVVKGYDVFEENNTVYIVMEQLEGKSLREYVEERGGLEKEEAIRFLKEICAGLKSIHDAGYLHRDIKPDNVIVTTDGRIKVLDLGAARQYSLGYSVEMTRILTAGYAPLEQYQKKGRYGPQTDIYALGAVMYYMVTGKDPQGSMERINEDIDEPADEISDSDISEVVRKCMKIKASERYQGCDELLDDIGGPIVINSPQVNLPQIKLVYKKNGQITNQEFQIPEGSVILGRFDPSTGPVDIDLSGLEGSSYISRKHAELYKDATTNSWYVKDLSSSNGTYLNRTKLEANKPEEIKKGDELSFGNMKFVVDS